MLKKLEEIDKQGYKWDGVKRLKSKYTPKFVKFKDKNGNRVSANLYHEKAAEYLATAQWGKKR